MSLTIFPLWSQQWTDETGQPLAGGLVYSVETGTTTPSPLYHDVDGDTEWSNPIELGADGRFTDTVYQAASPALDISVHDADDTPVPNLTLGPIQAYGAAEEPAPPGEAPAITTEPQDASISVGDNLVVSVVATGTAPLSYQWYLGSSGDVSNPIVGATAATYTAITPGADSYSGWCRISNAIGIADTTTVTVVVS